MANTIVCEILEYENTLREGGIPEKQIKAQVKALANIVESNLATKQDLKILYLQTVVTLGIINVATIGIAIALISYLKG